MSAHRGGPYASRDGLNSRSHLLGDQVQINIDPGQRFDYDSQLQDLRGDVLKIKQLAYAIDEERKLQGKDISALEEAMEQASMMMKKAMTKLKVVTKQSRHNLMLYVILFGIALFGVVFVLKKLYKVGRWIF